MKLKNNLVKAIYSLCLLSLPLLLGGCGIYSFSGTTISPDIKSISIQNFENPTGEGPANLTQLVTENFKNYYRRNTNLNLLQQEGDLQLEGQIVNFTVTPAAIQRDGDIDRAALNRLTLGVQVRFVNAQNPDENFDQLFTISKDFPEDQDVTQLSAAFINDMTEQLVTQVFNRTVANW